MNASLKRVNYDLHNVLGFYSLFFAFAIAATGLVWSFDWFEKGLYYITSGGDSKPVFRHPHSDISNKNIPWPDTVCPLDKAWYATLKKVNKVAGMYMTPILQDEEDPIEILVYHNDDSYYNQSEFFYDRYTLQPLEQSGSKFSEAALAQKLSMMNYDIHVGAVVGFPGKVLAFFISLICASLPVTGFLIWWNKRKKTKAIKPQ